MHFDATIEFEDCLWHFCRIRQEIMTLTKNSDLKQMSERPTAFGIGGSEQVSIVFFDGICGFCNQSVNFLLKRDSHRRLRFAPLQGQTAEKLLPEKLRRDPDTLVFLQGEELFLRSSAVVRILMTVGGFWKIAGVLLWLVPGPVRDFGYRMVARIRYRIFGRYETCRIPSAEERELFYD